MTKDFILGGGFIGCGLKQLMPNAEMITQKIGNYFPLILIHYFKGWEEFYSGKISYCKQLYEEEYDVEKYFLKSRGAIPDYYRTDVMPNGFNFVDFNYSKYFEQFKFRKASVLGLDVKKKKIYVAEGDKKEWIKFDNVYITFSPSKLGFKYKAEMPTKIALFRFEDWISSTPDSLFYHSNQVYHRRWDMRNNAIRGLYLEQSIPSIFPNNIMLRSPLHDGHFMGVWPGHIFAHFPERRREELEEKGIYLVGRNAELNYDRIDETLVRAKKRFHL